MSIAINGTDLFTSVGFVAGGDRKTSDSFLAKNSPKEVLSHDWPDENGIEYDLTAPVVLQPRTFVLDGYITASSEAEFTARYDALDTLINSPGFVAIIITIDTKTIRVAAKFKGYSQFKRLASLAGTGIKAAITMEFNEVMGVSLPAYNLFYGASAAIPSSPADVQALNQSAYASPLTFNTGTVYNTYSVVVQSGKSINTAVDLSAGVLNNIKPYLIQRGSVTINSITYNIYSMTNAAPFNTNHQFQITFN